jgi:hypothetical protein
MSYGPSDADLCRAGPRIPVGALTGAANRQGISTDGTPWHASSPAIRCAAAMLPSLSKHDGCLARYRPAPDQSEPGGAP